MDGLLHTDAQHALAPKTTHSAKLRPKDLVELLQIIFPFFQQIICSSKENECPHLSGLDTFFEVLATERTMAIEFLDETHSLNCLTMRPGGPVFKCQPDKGSSAETVHEMGFIPLTMKRAL